MEPLCGVQMRDKEVIVWEGRKYHTDWHHHSQHRIHPSPALRAPCAPRGQHQTWSGKAVCAQRQQGMKRWRGGCAARRKIVVSPHLYPREQEAEEKRQKQLLLYLHPTKLHKEQSLLHSQGPGCVRHSPRWSGQDRLGLEGHQFFLRGAWDSSIF